MTKVSSWTKESSKEMVTGVDDEDDRYYLDIVTDIIVILDTQSNFSILRYSKHFGKTGVSLTGGRERIP
jgi:cephalosporin-C deacetylase-like acetyl esterase